MLDYNSITKRLKSIRDVKVALIARLESGHPIYMLQCGEGDKGVFLSAGMHGDEPAGVEALLRFLELSNRRTGEGIKKWYDKYQFTIIPCINPTGLENGTRENIKGIDLNRKFGGKAGKDTPEEVRILQRAVEGKRLDLYIDFHEDIEGEGFYLYEVLHKGGRCVGGEIIADMSMRYTIDLRDRIDGFHNFRGVICPQKEEKTFPVRRSNLPFPLYMYLNGTQSCLTMESPTLFPWEDRVAMHLTAMEIALTLMA